MSANGAEYFPLAEFSKQTSIVLALSAIWFYLSRFIAAYSRMKRICITYLLPFLYKNPFPVRCLWQKILYTVLRYEKGKNLKLKSACCFL
jgi:hypothetical protein